MFFKMSAESAVSCSSLALYFWIHLWLKASSAVNLMSACLRRRFLIRSFASSLIYYQTEEEKS